MLTIPYAATAALLSMQAVHDWRHINLANLRLSLNADEQDRSAAGCTLVYVQIQHQDGVDARVAAQQQFRCDGEVVDNAEACPR
jgi:hypothetical protein